MPKRQPPRRQPARRRSGSSRPRTGPTPAQRAARLIDELGVDLRSADALQRALAASYAMTPYWAPWWDALAAAEQSGDEDATDTLAQQHPAMRLLALVSQLREPSARTGALTLIGAIEQLAPADDAIAERCAQIADKLRFLGAREPGTDASVDERVRLDGCWMLRDVFADELTLFVGVRYVAEDAGSAHTMVATMLQTGTFELLEVGVGEPLDEVLENVRASLRTEPDAAQHLSLVEVDAIEAGLLLLTALDVADASHGADLDDGSLEHLALLDARVAELFDDVLQEAGALDAEHPFVPMASVNASPLDELTVAEIGKRFQSSTPFAQAAITPSDDAVRELVEWVVSEVSGGAARVGPIVIEMYLHDLRDAAIELDDARVALLRAWTSWCAELTQLPADARAAAHEVIDEAVAAR